MDEDHAQFGGHQSPRSVHPHIVPGADVLNVHRNTGILLGRGGGGGGGVVKTTGLINGGRNTGPKWG